MAANSSSSTVTGDDMVLVVCGAQGSLFLIGKFDTDEATGEGAFSILGETVRQGSSVIEKKINNYYA